jgi:soluble cytochrome b562
MSKKSLVEKIVDATTSKTSKKKQLDKMAATFKTAQKITNAVRDAKTPSEKKTARENLQKFLEGK